ncbi:MAG: hypothetical protein ABJK28_07120 [Algibacter sp.]
MEEKFLTIKKVPLNNNCPECYSIGGLILTFKQKFIETTFYKSISSEIKYEIACKTCENSIYPVQWTDDIDRVFEYQKKAFVPKPKSTVLKKIAWIIIITAIILLFAGLLTLVLPNL